MLRAIGASLGKLDGYSGLGQYRNIPGHNHKQSESPAFLGVVVVRCASDLPKVCHPTNMFVFVAAPPQRRPIALSHKAQNTAIGNNRFMVSHLTMPLSTCVIGHKIPGGSHEAFGKRLHAAPHRSAGRTNATEHACFDDMLLQFESFLQTG